MSTLEIDHTPSTERLRRAYAAERPTRPSAWSASMAFGWRAMLKIRHVPEQLFDVTLFPIMMTLMFTYLFGGALGGSPTEYLQFFLPGILVVSIVMITMYTGLAVNVDIEKGVFDRFRSLPIWRPAPMIGYLLGDGVRYVIASVVIMIVGLILGYRPEGGVAGVLVGIAVLLAFSFALSWIWTMLGLMLRSEKSVMGVSMMVIMPLTFMSSAYVDTSTMPSWLETAGDLAILAVISAALIAVFGSATMYLYNRK